MWPKVCKKACTCPCSWISQCVPWQGFKFNDKTTWKRYSTHADKALRCKPDVASTSINRRIILEGSKELQQDPPIPFPMHTGAFGNIQKKRLQNKSSGYIGSTTQQQLPPGLQQHILNWEYLTFIPTTSIGG